jgi:hypothetical protein
MWLKSTTRKELLDLFTSGSKFPFGDVRETNTLLHTIHARPNEHVLIWKDNPAKFPGYPTVIVVDKLQRKDFFAWTLTYLKGFRPFTAYCRVIEPDLAERLIRNTDPPHLGRLENTCAGLILGEALSYLGPPFDVRALTPRLCSGTFSFAMSRALAMGLFADAQDPIGSTWPLARQLTKQPKLPTDLPALQTAWNIVRALADERSGVLFVPRYDANLLLLQACKEIMTLGDIRPATWMQLTMAIPEFVTVRDHMTGPRESRVVLIDSTLSLLMHRQQVPSLIRNFLIGYLVSRLAPGTFDHFSIICERGDLNALPWYGLCAGLADHSTVRNFYDGLGRRVLRDVCRVESLLDRPRCDVAIAELEMLALDNSSLSFRTGSAGSMEIEIAPCVNSVIRWPHSGESQPELLPALPSTRDVREILFELYESLQRVGFVSQKLERLFTGDDKPDPGPADKRKRTSPRK